MLFTSVKRKVANSLVACTIAAALLAVFVGFVAPPVAGANCARTGAQTPGDWTIGPLETQVCQGIVIVMDGNLLVQGSLTIQDGGVKFVEDAFHIYSISVPAGGTLRLVNSRIWTEAGLVNPYLKLNVTVSGSLVMANSTLAFPGVLTTSGATVNLTYSTITGTSANVLSIWADPVAQNDNNDAPALTFSGGSVQLFASRLEKIYENPSAPGADPRQIINLQGDTTLTAVDSFIGVDFNAALEEHNTLNLSGLSDAYLYGVTFDSSENPLTLDKYVTAVTPAAGSRADIYRWADVSVADSNQRPVAGADLNADFAGPEAGCASFRDGIGPPCIPPPAILWFMGKSSGTWDDTGVAGDVRMPLLSDWIDSTTVPNSRFVGTYNLVATAPLGEVGQGSLTFGSYPGMDTSNQSKAATVQISTLTQPYPELTISSIVFSGGNGARDFQPLNRPLTIVTTVNNTGTFPASNVVVNFYSENVDADSDGYLDQTHSFYVSAGTFIGSAGPFTVNASSSRVFNGVWTPAGTVEVQQVVSAYVDPETGSNRFGGGTVSELNEANNLLVRSVLTFVWPDLEFDPFPLIQLNPSIPTANNSVLVSLPVANRGTANALDVTFGIYTTSNVSVGTEVTLNVAQGATVQLSLTWVPTAPGTQTIRIRAIASGMPSSDPVQYRNFDYDYADVPSDNFLDRAYDVLTSPELRVTVPTPFPSPFRGQNFNLTVAITNAGQSDAFNILVAVRDRTVVPFVELGSLRLDVPPGTLNRVIPNLRGIAASGDRMVEVRVDSDNSVTETNELNNNVTVTIVVRAPLGNITVPDSPVAGQEFAPGVVIAVTARVIDALDSPIRDVRVTARLLAGSGEIANATAQSGTDGLFYIFLQVPDDAPQGTYQLFLDAEDASIGDRQLNVNIRFPLAWWQAPFLSLPVWIWLIVIIGAIAAIGGGTAYVKFIGIGKLVECGECGAFINEDSSACPKCGVEFEKDMAKCSNCQAWIPVDVKQCPECGVEFTTGEVGMEDYETKMRAQYDEVKRRYREQASQELGRSLTDREFEDWWRQQQTFVTFEDWIREEEEMRRMGSKPCPVCSTLNSVTAVVCHKCGTLLKESQERPRVPAGPATPSRPVAQTQPGPGAEEVEGGPGEAVPKKVIKKAVGAPVVQKKVIKRPLEEPKEGEEGEGEQF